MYLWEHELEKAESEITMKLRSLGFPITRVIENNLVNPRKRGVRRIKRANGERENQSRAKLIKEKV